jgi:uncharacterized delta-60 repeat protein
MQNSRSSILNINSIHIFSLLLLLGVTIEISAQVFPSPGGLDWRFGRRGHVSSVVFDNGRGNALNNLLFQPDGKMIVVGTNPIQYQDPRPATIVLARYELNGALDTTFGDGGVSAIPFPLQYGGNAYGSTLQHDGRIVVTGGSAQDLFVARYEPDGRLDESFGTAGVASTRTCGTATDCSGAGRFVFALPNGKLLVVGKMLTNTGISPDFFASDTILLQYLTDGRIDESFGTQGISSMPMNLSFYELMDARIDTGGSVFVSMYGRPDFPNPPVPNEYLIFKYRPDGTLDRSFGVGGKLARENGPYENMFMLLNGQFLVSESGKVVRHNPDGSADRVIVPYEQVINGVVFRPNRILFGESGKIVSIGSVWVNGQLSYFAMAEWFPNGRVDTSFGISGLASLDFDGLSQWSFLQPDGKIIFATFSNTAPYPFEAVRYWGDQRSFGSRGQN